MLKPFLIIFGSVILTACASWNSSSGGTFFDSAFNDHNPAPNSMTPSPDKVNGENRLDPQYLRTQADYYFQVGEALSLEGNHKKAIEAFKLVSIYDSQSSVVQVRLAGEYVKLGQLTLALEHGEAAVQKNPRSVDARILLGGIYSTMKFYEKALEQYETILKIDKDNLDAPLYIGALYAEKKDYDSAIKAFMSLATNDENNAPQIAWYYVGRIRVEQNKKNSLFQATEAFKKALSLKPDYVEAVIALGNNYIRQKNEEKAAELYKNFQREHGVQPRIAEFLVQYYLEKGKIEAAYEQLEILEGNSDDPINTRMRMALILIEKKAYEKAIVKLQEILAQAPESDKVRFYLAAVYEETQQHSKAVENFLRIPPESQYFGESVVHAAYLHKQSKNLDESMRVIKEGLKVRQDIPQFYTIYASLLDEKNQYQEASVVLEDAVKKFPDNLQVNFFLGTILDRLGNKKRVIEQMRKVISLDPRHVQGLNYLAFTLAEQSSNLDEAEQFVRQAVSIEPQDGYVLDTLGWILFKQGRTSDAIKYLEAAFKYQPNEAIIAEHLGDAYKKHQLFEKAKLMYRKAADAEIDSVKAKEIREKISSLERQDLKNSQRTPSSINSIGSQK